MRNFNDIGKISLIRFRAFSIDEIVPETDTYKNSFIYFDFVLFIDIPDWILFHLVRDFHQENEYVYLLLT
jgi:hypothetical protein